MLKQNNEEDSYIGLSMAQCGSGAAAVSCSAGCSGSIIEKGLGQGVNRPAFRFLMQADQKVCHAAARTALQPGNLDTDKQKPRASPGTSVLGKSLQHIIIREEKQIYEVS